MNEHIPSPFNGPYVLAWEEAKHKAIELEREEFDIARERIRPAEGLRLRDSYLSLAYLSQYYCVKRWNSDA